MRFLTSARRVKIPKWLALEATMHANNGQSLISVQKIGNNKKKINKLAYVWIMSRMRSLVVLCIAVDHLEKWALSDMGSSPGQATTPSESLRPQPCYFKYWIALTVNELQYHAVLTWYFPKFSTTHFRAAFRDATTSWLPMGWPNCGSDSAPENRNDSVQQCAKRISGQDEKGHEVGGNRWG